MDLQFHRGSASSSDAQQLILPSGYMSLENWSSASFFSTCEIQTISSLVSSTVFTIMPHPATNENTDPVSSARFPGTSTASEEQDQKTSPCPCDNTHEAKQREPTDDLLEERSIGLIFPKNLCEDESGKIHVGRYKVSLKK